MNRESTVEKPYTMYMPRDEQFEESKQNTFAAGRLKAVLHNLIPQSNLRWVSNTPGRNRRQGGQRRQRGFSQSLLMTKNHIWFKFAREPFHLLQCFESLPSKESELAKLTGFTVHNSGPKIPNACDSQTELENGVIPWRMIQV
ncbi:hypothetical protein LguiA_013368 [Lonicera macranthoides]